MRRFAARGVRLLGYSVNRGKAPVLDSSVPRLSGDIVLLSDANTHMEPDAARRLAGWFADPAIGVVCGRLVLTDARSGQNVDGLYWKYETFLKKCESRLGALLGSNGAIYAIRKELFPRRHGYDHRRLRYSAGSEAAIRLPDHLRRGGRCARGNSADAPCRIPAPRAYRRRRFPEHLYALAALVAGQWLGRVRVLEPQGAPLGLPLLHAGSGSHQLRTPR